MVHTGLVSKHFSCLHRPFTLNEGFGGLGTELGAYNSSLVSEPDPLGTSPSGSETTSSFPFLLHSLSLSLEGPLLTKEFAPVDAVLDEGKKDREIAANDFCHSFINYVYRYHVLN